MSKTNQILWIFFNQYSNQDKLKKFTNTADKSGFDIRFVDSKSVLLQMRVDGTQNLVNADSGEPVTLPRFVVSLIPDEKIDPAAYVVLEYLEASGAQLLNSVRSVRLATDKYKSGLVLAENGFSIPQTMLFSRYNSMQLVSYPCVIKPIDGRKSRGVRILKSESELAAYLALIPDELFIIQDFIESSFRKDIRVFIFDGKYLGAVHRTAHAKTFASVVAKPIKISLKKQQLAQKAAKLLGLTFCSVDFFVDEKQTICEVNANPGFNSLEKHVTTDLHQLIYSHFQSKIQN